MIEFILLIVELVFFSSLIIVARKANLKINPRVVAIALIPIVVFAACLIDIWFFW